MSNFLPQVKWLVIDGLPFSFLKKYLDPNTMPYLMHMMEQGLITPLEPLWPNCQTPPSLFSIWSGQPAAVHQIFGYDTPHGEQAGAFRNGFTQWPDSVDMVWDTWAQAGLDVRLNHIPFVNESKLSKHLIARSNIYGEVLYESCVFTNAMFLSTCHHDLMLTLQPLETKYALLHVNGDGIKLTKKLKLGIFIDIELPPPLEGTLTVMVNQTPTGELEGALLGKNSYYRSGKKPMQTGHAHGTDFCHVSLAKLYRNNQLGTKKGQGGEGDAEKKLFASLARVHQSFYKELAESFAQNDAALTVGYYPVIDIALHEIINMESMAKYDSEITDYFRQIMLWTEALVEVMVKSCSNSDILIINSDHGMQPIGNVYYLNQYLAQQGWLTFDAQGQIDYKKTSAAYHPAENGTLLIHKDCDATEICESICAFFREAGLQGASVVRLPTYEYQKSFDIGWFLLPPDGVRVKASYSDSLVSSSKKAGDHCGYSPLADLKGTFISNHKSYRPSIMQMYDIKKFILDK